MTHIAGNPADFDNNPFTDLASQVSPIDEAKAFPLLFQELANALPNRELRSLLCDKAVQSAVIAGAHARFTQTSQSEATDWQNQLRRLMRDHLCYQSLGGMACLADFGPTSSDDTWVDSVLDRFVPGRKKARYQAKRAEADLLVEQMVAKFVITRLSIVEAMFDEIAQQPTNLAHAA